MHRRAILLAVVQLGTTAFQRGEAAVHVPGPPEMTFVEFTRRFRPAGYLFNAVSRPDFLSLTTHLIQYG
jgi:hypothetical protein